MNCSDVRDQLPGLLYGDLRPEDKVQVEKHLSDCPGCRREYDALQGIRRLLESLPAPEVEIDLPRLYRQAAQRQERRVRRWRRVAIWVSSAAALLVVLAFGVRLEARLDSRQLVIRWGSPTEPANEVSPGPPSPAPEGPEARPSGTAEPQLQLLSELIHALAYDMQAIERQQRQDEETFQIRLQNVDLKNSRRLADLERLLRAYSALSQKGEER